jgi:predicted ATPase
LDVSGTAALLSTQLAAETISDELVALVHERAEGNPFFTEELLKALVDQGVVYESAGRWQHKQLRRR